MRKNNKTYNFNGGWSKGDANHHIGRKNKTKVHTDSKKYTRKQKHKSSLT